jgi:hypothetical protein
MKTFIDKLSSYNLFNYLFPGIIFAVMSEKITPYSFLQDDIVVGFFVYYFIGLVVSRFGSLVAEPILIKAKFLKFATYDDYVKVSQKDPKVELLSEVNNMYRTISSLFILLVFLKLYSLVEYSCPIIKHSRFLLLALIMLIIFLFSYKKQTIYITNRINTKK